MHEVAKALWHHFDGPRAQQLANDTVFRFDDGRIVPEQAEELEALWKLLGRARILTVTRGLPTGSIALNALRSRARARSDDRHRPPRASSPASP